MIIVAATDDRGAIAFNHRRVSSDRVLTAWLVSLAQESRLWMNEYSSRLFEGADVSQPHISVDPDFPERAAPGEFCLFETTPPDRWLDRAERVIAARWNRRYPGDLFLTLPPDEWKLTKRREFPGYSHEKITIEEYTRA